ncbi:hypothetical protein SAMN05216516_10261 [Izhakiella capsodis]|uniref:Opacity-associated protein A LysM-like domain-containing protein n=1 Tax=Izhakiella capsodis TaxID=1367852 RepID=A0A1I4VTK3_9GAMM|nr:LysM-like peptidoglycan-binding domain-containing protein [Izhakiella capsodis]SFN04377.1 hypothetical protein SAMN05216516_10261 [Izhakiella capsodis]
MPCKGLIEILHRLWLLPAELRWMDPLPLVHRRGIIASVALVLVVFLWPSPAPRDQITTPTYHFSRQTGNAVLQANIVDNDKQQQSENTNNQTQLNMPPESNQQGSWHDYTIAKGQTLAQLFRDNNMQISDVFAMARVEGNGKPLSNLQQGQTVKVRVDAQGVVTGLTVEGSNGPVLFTRQPDGSFIRVE